MFPTATPYLSPSNTNIQLTSYPDYFEEPLDEQVFAILSWIAGIGCKSKESLLRNTSLKNETLNVML